MHYLCLRSCLEVNRPEAVYFYYRHEPWGRYWDLIREEITLVRTELTPFVSRFHYRDRHVRMYRYAHHSDFIRLEKLVAEGGVYADMDTIFVNPITPQLFSEQFVLGREDDVVDRATGEKRRSLCNAFIMAERGAEFGRLWLQAMENAFDGTWSRHSTLLPQELSQQRPDLVHVEPSRTFYKHMWTREGIATLFEGLDADYTGVLSMHLWSHLWWSRWRRDFSRFHAGKLNEDFVRYVDTTYNLAARRFLPPRRKKST
jgi:hypothetical protein